MRIVHVHPLLAARFRGLTSFVEALLCGIAAMGVQGGWPSERVFQALPTLAGKPDALFPIAPVVLYQHIGVDTPAFRIERIRFRLGQGTGKLHRSEHLSSFLRFDVSLDGLFPHIPSSRGKTGNAAPSARLTASVETERLAAGSSPQLSKI